MRAINDSERPWGFYEFFCGGGMARLALGESWRCLFANDFDARKAASYRANFGGAPELVCCDVRMLKAEQLPPRAMLAWASFPCQDLSLAGQGAGLRGSRSGVFWAFWQLIRDLGQERREPPVVAIENVAGLITSHGGQDLAAVALALAEGGYRPGALLVDGVHFVPQSRPRLFIIAVRDSVAIPAALLSLAPARAWGPPSLERLVDRLPPSVREAWVWWHLPEPRVRPARLVDVIEDEPRGVEWHSPAETQKLLDMISPANQAKILAAMEMGARQVGSIYKRTRQGVQRAEVRFDGVSGCLRTPAGGSSRQIIIEVRGRSVRTRLISPRETARLMGLPDTYLLPGRYNEAYHLTGDGVVVPVVSWIERCILRPLAGQIQRETESRPILRYGPA